MNQRKMVGVLSILLLAILFITVGCGDGKRNPRTNFNKRPSSGKTGPQLPKPDSPEFKAKKTAMEKATAEYESAIQGDRLASLPEGEYSLTEILAFVDYINSNEEFKYLRRIAISQQGANIGQQSGDGVVLKSPDKNGREILVPNFLNIAAGAALTPDIQNSGVFTMRVVDASMDSKGVPKMKLDVDFQGAAALPGLTLVDLIAQNKTLLTLRDGKSAELFLIKQQGDRMAIQLVIHEGAQPGQQNDSSKKAAMSFPRKMVFVYNYKTKPAQGAPPPTAQQQQQQQQPARDQEQAPAEQATAE